MSARIYAELTDDFCRRMRNWARWWWDSRGTIGPATVRACNLEPASDHYHEASIPLLSGEAEDTEGALNTLPARYQQVVRQWWLYEKRSLSHHARARHVTAYYFEQWVIRGHEILRAELLRRTAAHLEHQQQARRLHAGA